MPASPGRARVNFEIEEDLNRRMQRVIPWGNKAPCLRVLTEKLVDAVERHGLVMVGAVMSGEFRLVYEPRGENEEIPIMGNKGKRRNHSGEQDESGEPNKATD